MTDPATSTEVVTKQYADNANTLSISKCGDTRTGDLVLIIGESDLIQLGCNDLIAEKSFSMLFSCASDQIV